jgi:hypothetical protein
MRGLRLFHDEYHCTREAGDAYAKSERDHHIKEATKILGVHVCISYAEGDEY